MTMVSIGDMSQFFVSRQHNMRIRDHLNTLTQELATGHASDMTRHLGADRARLSDMDRQLGLSQGYATATRDLGQHLATMQVVLESIDGQRSDVAARLIQISPASSLSQQANASEAARQAFGDMVSSLNTRFGGQALFSGVATDQLALADADTMLAAIKTEVLGATTASDVLSIVDDWFDNPAGGFATLGYTGDTGAAPDRRIDTASSVIVSARADQPALRDLLKATALAALAADPTLALPANTGATVLMESAGRLLSSADPLTAMRADLGLSEQRVETATARHTARLAAIGIMRNDLTRVDPYATATALQEVQAQLETHYTLTARLATLSLVGFLR